jgi:hypothetical protein
MARDDRVAKFTAGTRRESSERTVVATALAAVGGVRIGMQFSTVRSP